MAQMTARYPGTCSACGARFRAGTLIEYDRDTRATRHAGCQPYEPPQGAETVSIGEGYGGREAARGTVLRHPEPARAGEIMVVDRCQSTYYRDDGMSFGVGDEAGYVYTYTLRAATPDEAAPLLAREAAQARRAAARTALHALVALARQQGTFPPRPEGEYVHLPARATILEALDSRTVYGGGTAWAVDPGDADHDPAVWCILGNGGDGDHWASNNGAGCMLWCLSDPDGAHAGTLHAAAQALGAPTTDEDADDARDF